MRMAERGIDDRCVGNGEDQFLGADARQEAMLGQQAVVGGVIQFENGLQVGVVVSNRDEHTVAAGEMARGYEPVGVELPNEREGWNHRIADRRLLGAGQPARRASSSRRTVCIAGSPPRIM
jgi:hypothetical protein